MITFNQELSAFILHTPHTTYMCGIADGKFPGHIYYGARLEDEDLRYLMRTAEDPYLPSENEREKVRFLNSFPMEYPFSGTGDFREPCVSVLSAQGQEGLELHYEDYRIFAGREVPEGLPHLRGSGEDCDTLEIRLADRIAGVEVYVTYVVFRDTDAIARSARIVNAGSEDVTLTRALSMALHADLEAYEVITLQGSWARERHIHRRGIDCGAIVSESIRGESSHQDNPFLAVVSPATTQTAGPAWGMNLVYSGNFLTKVQVDQFGQLRAVMGIHPYHFSWCLKSGESFQTPECVLVYSDEGLGGMTRAFHDTYRAHLLPQKWVHAYRPSLVNNWEATFMAFDTRTLLEFAAQAKECGIEMLVMDDGWFGGRDDDSTSLGDWYVNEEKLQGGLKYLVDEVNKMGLKFGIWVEPEMVSVKSRMYEQHPDWAFALKGRETNQYRAQMVLDLTRDEVWHGVYDQIKAVLASANIEYVKWDMNRPLSHVGNLVPGGKQGELYHRYVLALYRMQEQLITDFPHILLENCSSGGARFDAGMLFYSPQIWTSDDTDAIERLRIQEGTAICYPLSSMGAHVSECPNMQTGRNTPFETRAHAAMMGSFGYELDIRKLPEEEKAQIPGQIELYRRQSEVVRDGDYYRIASYAENHVYDCWEVVAKDKSRAYVTYVQVLAEPHKRSRRVLLQGLDPDRYYLYEGARLQGRTLMNAGVLMKPMMGDYKSVVLEIVSAD